MLSVFWICCVQVKSSAGAKVPVDILSFDTGPTRRSVGEKQSDALGGGDAQKGTLLSPIVRITRLGMI